MTDPLKEKYNILKGVVALFDTKLSATVIVTLIIAVVMLSNKVGSLQQQINDQKGEMYERLISEMKGEVRKQIEPIKRASNDVSAKVDSSTSKVDSITTKMSQTLKTINSNIKKSLK